MRTLRLALLAVVGTVGAFAASAADAPAAAAASCGPAPAGQVAVVVLIDTGSGAVAQRCVTVAERSTGMDALLATGSPVRAEGGFVCGIGGVPATGCAKNQSPDVDSWSYWHATPGGSWTFSTVGGPWYRLPERCAVEGWSYGPSNPKRPPRMSPPRVACELPPARPAPPPPPPPPAAPAPAPAPPDRGSDVPADRGAPASGGAPAPDPEAGAPGSGEATPPDAAAGDGSDASTETEDDDPSGSEEEVRAGVAEPEASSEEASERTLSVGDDPGSASGGSWIGVVVLLVAAVGVGGGAVLRSRRRKAA